MTQATVDTTGVSQYYSALEAQANSAVGSIVKANITPIQAGDQGDFAYNYQNPSLLFNQWTYNYLSTMAQAGDYPGTAKLTTAGSFPQTYLQLVDQIEFLFSNTDLAALSAATTRSQQQQTNLVETYTGLYGQITPDMIQAAATAGWLPAAQTPFDYIVSYVVGGMWAGKSAPPALTFTTMATAENLNDLLPDMPPDGPPVTAALSSYLNVLGPQTSLMDQQDYGNSLQQSIRKTVQSPTAGTNAITTFDPSGPGANQVVLGYGISKSAQQIVNDLNSGQEISMTLSVQKQSQSQYTISINAGTSFSYGGPIVSFSDSAGAEYNMEDIQGSGSTLDISIVYKGYSLVPLAPQPYQTVAGGTTGWYLPTMLSEAYSNWEAGSQRSTGFTFQNAPVVNLAQFPSGAFNLLSNLLISSYPTITITYTGGDYSLFSSQFSAQASGSVTLFGLIPIGSASMSTYSSQLQQGSSNSQFSVSFTPPSTTDVPTYQQTAYVIGGVVVSPAQSQASLVEALLLGAAM